LNEKSGGQWGTNTPKTRKMDLRAGCCRGTNTSNSQGSPKIQGCSLRKIERKIGWSYGTDHPENEKRKRTLQIAPVQPQCRQCQQILFRFWAPRFKSSLAISIHGTVRKVPCTLYPFQKLYVPLSGEG
jgi:hypothetical protein